MSQTTPARQHALDLMARRDQLEKDLKEQQVILRQNDNVGLHSPLVDPEGFPRSDIDVYAVRYARVRIIELTNDIRDLTDQLAVVLNTVYEPQAEEDSETEQGAPSSSRSDGGTGITSGSADAAPHPDRDLKPFARVDGVMPGSPAADAGLIREDLILQFGTLTSEKVAGGLQPIAQLVNSNEDRSIVIRIRRRDVYGTSNDRDLNFTPRKWGGRGLLGCHIVPAS
ncbi:putative 26S proteasome regulatory subunit [Tulasnella sp. JGI-2019a]|nr:putative 26S proteasome regulatory subunit [Tulasnella sp. JGI-2019a]KAG8998607.1 putative 26S proteasome regulatory subunit [Tulasnella sp. JGI-2019a]KAG9034494.1 putative 26S proteasome regulatory subunit [Tulasnella sp. JGI-2019a]